MRAFLLAGAALVLTAASARAGATQWQGGAVGDWNVPGNWSAGVVPGAGDDVTITGGFVIDYATNPALWTISLNSLTLGPSGVLETFTGLTAGAATLQTGSALQFGATAPVSITGTFSLAAGSSATYSGPPVSAGTVPPLHLQAGLFSLAAGSTVTVLGGGYAGGAFASAGAGPNGGTSGGFGGGGLGGGGGGHAAAGGSGGNTSNGGPAFDSNPPADGGGGGGGGTLAPGGAGGGLLVIDASTAALDGFVQADGAAGTTGGQEGGGGGAGGGVLVRAAVLTGAGTISAQGGAAGGGSTEGGGGGGGGFIWLRESSGWAVFHATLTVLDAGGSFGGGGIPGSAGGAGAAFVDPRHWTAAGPDALASDALNWSDGLVPSGGERVVFGGSTTASGCQWDLSSVVVGSMSLTSAWASTVTLDVSLDVAGCFTQAGGSFTAPGNLDLSVGGNLYQTGGRFDLFASSLTLPSPGGASTAAFYDARAGALLVGGATVSTTTEIGLLEVVGYADLSASATLFLGPGARLRFDGGGPFVGPGSVNASTCGVVQAWGGAAQTWTAWPGTIGALRDSNASGLILSPSAGAFALGGGVLVDTTAVLSAPGADLLVGGNWSNYGSATLTFSTVAFTAVAGTQAVIAGGVSFDNIVVDDPGATLQLSTYVVVADSVGVYAGTLNLAASTLEVRGSWTENPGGVVVGSASVTIFDGFQPQKLYQLSGNAFGTFRSSSSALVQISSTLATNAGFEWHQGDLNFSGAALTIGGDFIFHGGILLTVAGSTVVFDGTSLQTLSFPAIGSLLDENFSSGGLLLGAPVTTFESFTVQPGAVFNGGGCLVTVTGPFWNTALSTYTEVNTAHSVLWQPTGGTVTVEAGSVVDAKLAVGPGATAVLQGDLNLSGAGNTLDPQTGSTIVNAPGGSTIAFRGSTDLIPSAGFNWSYAGDVADSWLVFEGTGAARGASISSTTFGTLRVTLNTSTDVFKAPTLNLLGRLILEQGDFKASGGVTVAVGGDVIQNGGTIDFESVSTGTVLLTGPSTQTIRLLTGEHELWNLTDASPAAVQCSSDLTVGGAFVVSSGTFLAGDGNLGIRGRVQVSSGAFFNGQTSTVTLNGAAGGVAAQSLRVFGAALFNGLAVNVQTANLLTSATAAVFSDPFAGGTLAVAPGVQLDVADLRLGPSGGANLTVESMVSGSPWYLDVTAVSSATAVTASDSNASPGLTIQANDGRSVNAGGDVNWDFNPILLVLLPGETFTPAAAPGKTGAPLVSTAGASIPVTVLAVSSRFDLALASTGTVTLTSDDQFALESATQPLANGSAAFTFTPFIAEPLPRFTHVIATTFFGSNVSTTSVIPAGLARLQIILPGEGSFPGSPTGRGGSPFPHVKAIPFSALVRSVDPFWNAVATVTDSFAFGTTASSSDLPAPPSLVAGQAVVNGIIIYSTGLFTLSVTDLTEPLVQSATSNVFGVEPPSVSSPSAAFYIPTGASIATLGGAIAGTAADSSSISRVRVDVLEVETSLHFNALSGTFASFSAIYTTMTLAAPLAPSTSWSNPVPDSALVTGRHYAATALVDDPTGFTGVAASTFVVDRAALSFGSGSGLGTAAALPASAPGCQPLVATVTYTVGGAGISAGGAVAVLVPQGWTPPTGLSALSPPPPGDWSVTSTAAVAGSAAAVNPASFAGQPLGAGWVLLSVATNSAGSYPPGTQIVFQYSGLPPLSPAGRGAQTFAVWATDDGTGPLAPISTQPVVSLAAGTTGYLAFADPTPLSLGPLQLSSTIQLKVVDQCGNDDLGASSGTASLALVAPVGGGYVPDATARFFSASGGAISSVFLSTGFSRSPGFEVETSTSGPTLEYLQATTVFTAASSTVSVTALRPVLLSASSETFTAVSVDTGTLTPGATTAALSASTPDAYPGRLVFTLADPTLSWTAVLSTDGVNFSSPAFTASGSGSAAGPIALTWDGVNRLENPPAFAAAGHYHARLSAGGGSAQNETVEIVVPPTPGYFGALGAAGAGAAVRAVGPGAGEGSDATASSTGYFLLTGLHAGQAYQVTVATVAGVGGLPVTLTNAVAAPAAAVPVVNLGAISLPVPATFGVAAVLPVPSPFEAVGGFVGRAADGSVAFTGALRFSTGSATSDDGGPLFGRAASTESVALALPGVYTLELDIPDLNLSTAIPSVTVAPGGSQILVPFSKGADVFGYAVLPSTAAGGTTVSLQATSSGTAVPSAFGAVSVSSVPPAVGPSSGAYALYGLSPGTWTVLASAPGFMSASTTILVTGYADTTGLDLALGVGGTIVGTVTVTGNSSGATQCFAGTGGAPGSCAPGTFDVSVQAQEVGALGGASAGVLLSSSAVSSSGTFALTGLSPGLWNVSASLPGFAPSPSGGLLVSVAGASVSTAALSLAAQDARLSLTVNLPPLAGDACRAPSSWSGLGLSFDGSDGASRVFGDATALAGAGSFESLNCSSATFFTPALPPGPVRAAALFAPSGAWAYARALLVNGTTASLTLSLTASSVPASGLLSVSGPISIATSAAGGIPFTVLASSPAGILSAAPGISFCLLGSHDPVPRTTLRAELVPYDPISGEPALRTTTGGPGSCAAPAASTAAATSLGFAAGIATDGSFTFFPGVAPGQYLLRVPGELDGNPSDGAEAVEYDQLVTIGSGGAVLAPQLGHGSSVSGLLSAPANLPPGRLFQISLVGSNGAAARGAAVAPPPGGAAAFSFSGLADGVYALTAADLSSPRAFSAPPAAVTVAGANVAAPPLALGASGTISARLSAALPLPNGTQQNALILPSNASLLPPGFAAVATADPAAPGAVYASLPAASGALVDDEGRLSVTGLAPGTYDVLFSAPVDTASLAAGGLALASTLVSGVSVAAGQIADLGVVTLLEGAFLSGRATDAGTGAPVAGLTVSAQPSASAGAASGAAAAALTATTDASGSYLLRGLSPTVRWYDVTAAPRGALISGGAPPPPYASQRVLSVDVSSGAALNFALSPAAATVTGHVVAPNGAALTASLPGQAAALGAVVYLQTAGVPPAQDPFANLALQTNPDGTFTIPSVATGAYVLTATALGQGEAVRSVIVSTAATDLGTVTLGAGGSLSGAVRLPDGSSPLLSEVQALAMIASDSSDFIYAALTLDPTGTSVTGYAVSGMIPGKTYRLVVSGPGGSAYVPPAAAAVVFASTADARQIDLSLVPVAGPVSFRASRSGSQWNVTTQFPRPLRSLYASDSNPALLLTTAAATGALSGGALTADRLTLTAAYNPGVAETSSVLLASAALAATDWSSTNPASRQLTVSATVALQLVGDGVTRQTVANGFGGALTFDGDAGRVVLPRGAFNVDAATGVAVSFTRSASPAAFGAAPPPSTVASSLYDISLPGGIPTGLARPATLTLAYSTSVVNPAGLNLYWYNPAAGTYVLQPDVVGGPPVVDGSARTVTVRVNHFSTYVLLDSAAGAIGGAAFGGGVLDGYNFPNPFDLSFKTVTTIHGGGSPTIRGTLVRVSVPPGISGEGSLKVFDITGRLLRSIDMGPLAAGEIYYQNWDGRNDFGRDVASGLYLCEISVGGQRKIFKMAVIK